jgi:hypothetical protein
MKKQQAPHGLGVQFVPLPWKLPPDVRQLVCVSTWQLPLLKQQAPVCCAIGPTCPTATWAIADKEIRAATRQKIVFIQHPLRQKPPGVDQPIVTLPD